MSSLEENLSDSREKLNPPLDTQLNGKDNADDDINMVAASKELSPEKEAIEKAATTAEEGIFSLIYTVAKKLAVVGAIYLVGYMGWSVAWLIAPVIYSGIREKLGKENEKKRNIAKSSAMASEKDVILARIDELPAWVYFPDVERCEWVNKILKQIWPNANYFARTLVKETIEPNVALALSNYKLNGFRFDRIILGTIPPRIGGVKIYDKNVDRNEIIMDMDIFYASDCDINFYLGGVKGGIKDFQIHGWIRVVMKPLIRSIPLIGGLQIFFLNNPNVDFNLVGAIDFLDMPGLSDLLRRIIVEQIGAIMVLPNKLPITLSNDVPAVSLKMPEPEGILRIHVVEAKDLMKKDISVLGKGKSDPYAIINVGAQEFKTQTIDNTVNPKWDFWCEAKVFAESGQFLDITLFDFDDTSNDEKLGRASVDISQVVKKGLIDTENFTMEYKNVPDSNGALSKCLWFESRKFLFHGVVFLNTGAEIIIFSFINKGWLTLEEAKHGLLHVRLSWYKLTADPQDMQAALLETQLLRVTSMSTALLIVFVDSAKNLPHARTASNPDPYLVVSVGKQTEQTPVQLRNDSPVWEQGFTFLVGNPDNDTLQMKICDQKTGNEIGRFSYILSTLVTMKDMQIVSQPFQLQKSGPESKIVMTLALRVLKRADSTEDNVSIDAFSMSDANPSLSRTSSVRTASQVEGATISSKAKDVVSSSMESSIVEEDNLVKPAAPLISVITPPRSPRIMNPDSVLTHRIPDTTTSAGEHNRGRIQMSIHYSITRQKLSVTIHKIMHIPLTDPSNIPDPYVKLYLLPGRAKESKRKTNTIKDNCNPVYEATFEYVISSAEIMQTDLEVTVCTQKGFLYGGSPVIGMLKISLAEPDISAQGLSSWFDLQPETKHD